MKFLNQIMGLLTAAVLSVTAVSVIPPEDKSENVSASAASADYPVQEFRLAIGDTSQNISISDTKNGSYLNSQKIQGTQNEKWSLNYVSNGTYEIVNSATGYIVTNNNGRAAIAPDVDGANQRWNIVGVDKDFEGYYINYKIVSSSDSNTALTFNAAGNSISAQSYTGSTYQKFKLNLDGIEGFAANCKVSEGEKAGVIGGLLGKTVTASTDEELINYLNSTEPLTVVVSANIDMKSHGHTRIRDNKTIVGSYTANTLYDVNFRTNNEYGTAGDEPSDNIVIRNIDFQAVNVKNRILVNIWSSRNIWIDHCSFLSKLSYDRTGNGQDEVGKFIWINTPYDSYMDAKDRLRSPDYITISYCTLQNRYWTVAYGTQNDETSRCRTTLCYNKWDKNVRRCPQIGNGNGHIYNNYYEGYDSGNGSGTSQIIGGEGSNIVSENCRFQSYENTYPYSICAGGGSEPYRDSGSYYAKTSSDTPSKFPISPKVVSSWYPNKENYGYSLIGAYNTKGTDTKDFCNKYAGCFKSYAQIKYITDSDLASFVATKYNSPFLKDIQVTESGTVTNFTDGSVFMIKNVNSGLYIDVEGAKAANGTNCQQWGAAEAGIQNTWKLVSAGDDYYYIVSAVGDGGSYVLDVSGKSSADGANIQIYSYKGTDNQKFKFTKNSDGSYKILTKISGDKSGVEIANAETTSGSNVQQWTINGANCQDWILESVTNPGCAMDTSVKYEFKNVNSGMVMDITSGSMQEGTNVQQWGSGHFASQQWSLQEFAGGGNYYYIRSAADPSYVLKAMSGSNGGNIEIVPYSTKDSMMLFKFSKNPDGSYHIMTRSSKDGCLVEIENASTASGANVQQWEPNGNNCQKWEAVTFTTTTTTTTVTTITTTTAAPTVPTTTTVPADVKGDVNNDGKLNVSDLVMIQKWILKMPYAEIVNWKAGDLCEDDRLDSFDLCFMRRELINQKN